jgi:hypothetical protein
LNHVNNKKKCCKGRCLKISWRGKDDNLDEHDGNVQVASLKHDFGKKFLEDVIVAIQNTYHTSSYKSSVELKAILQKDVGINKMFYKFYHHGKLGDSPNVPCGLMVRTFVVRLNIILVAAS